MAFRAEMPPNGGGLVAETLGKFFCLDFSVRSHFYHLATLFIPFRKLKSVVAGDNYGKIIIAGLS